MSRYRSNVIVTLALAVAFVALEMTNAQSDIYQYGEKRQDGSSARKYCGQHLSNALGLICDGIYNPMFKKSGQEMEMDDYPYAYDYPFRTRASANAMMGRFGGIRFRRQTQGVHDECCVKPCSMTELMTYCGRH